MSSEPVDLSSDGALTDPTRDQLGHALFARNLAESILAMGPGAGLVVGLYGPLGAGKSTVLNFLDASLREPRAQPGPAVVRLDGWWLAGEEGLAQRFLEQIEAQLEQSALAEKLHEPISHLADLVAPSRLAAKSGASAEPAGDLSLPQLKRQIASTLVDTGARIVVLIDDLDRLRPDEMRRLFRTIKSVADFSNVTYVLAMDRSTVSRTLDSGPGSSGDADLDQVVQVSFDLPVPDATSLREVLFQQLGGIVGESGAGVDRTAWSQFYWEGIDHFIKTPRDVSRLIHALAVSFPAVRGNVDPVEYIVVEVLRLFCPGAYHRVRGYGYCFAGPTAESETEAGGPEAQSLRSFHEAWITQIPPRDKEATRRLLSQLFPRVSRVWGGPASLYAKRAASGREISNPQSFPFYFRLAVPDDTVPSADIASILTNASDSQSLSAELRRLAACSRPDGRSWARSALEQLVEYTDREMTEAQVPVVLQALFESGDEMVRPEDEPRGVFDQSSGFMVRRIIWRLLVRLDEPRRYQALEAATARGRALSTIVNATTMMAGGTDRNAASTPDAGQMLTPAHLSHLEVAMLQRIRAAAADRSLLSLPQLVVALSRWQACGDRGEAETWVRGVAASDAGLLLLIERFYRLSLTDFFDGEDYGPAPFFDLESFQRFLDPTAAAARAQKFAGDARLSANQQAALTAFLERSGENRTRTDP